MSATMAMVAAVAITTEDTMRSRTWIRLMKNIKSKNKKDGY